VAARVTRDLPPTAQFVHRGFAVYGRDMGPVHRLRIVNASSDEALLRRQPLTFHSSNVLHKILGIGERV